jgi:ATP-dependent RNA helicase UAP56/SUB2
LEILCDQSKLKLLGIQQYYVNVAENDKIRVLIELLDSLEFYQTIVFVRTWQRADELNKRLRSIGFPSTCMHSYLPQQDRIARFLSMRNYETRILVATDIMGRGIDFERVNIVFNYDMPDFPDQYLHQMGRAGRFGTKGLAISFISTDSQIHDGKNGYKREFTDHQVLEHIQNKFDIKIAPMPARIDLSMYTYT